MDAHLGGLLAEYERLLDERAALLDDHAPVWARYGPGGTAAMLRSHKVAKLKKKLRDDHSEWSEARLQESVEGAEEFATMIRSIEERRTEYSRQKDALDLSSRRLALLTTRIRLAGAAIGDATSGEATEGGDRDA